MCSSALPRDQSQNLKGGVLAARKVWIISISINNNDFLSSKTKRTLHLVKQMTQVLQKTYRVLQLVSKKGNTKASLIQKSQKQDQSNVKKVSFRVFNLMNERLRVLRAFSMTSQRLLLLPIKKCKITPKVIILRQCSSP